MKIDTHNLKLLHKYLQDGGNATEEGFKEFLGTTSIKTVKAYQDALVEAYPDIYGDDETEEEDISETVTVISETGPVIASTVSVSCVDKKVFIRDTDTNVATELELEKETVKSKIYVVKAPKDEVEILVAGETITVDLIKLKKLDKGASFGGHKVSTLILAAELAKA